MPPTPAEIAAAGASVSPMQRLFEVLALEGHKPTFNESGDIDLRFKDLNYVIVHSKQDAEFLRILVPQIYTVVDEEDRAIVLLAANYVNGYTKTAKVYVYKQGTHAAIEYYTADPVNVAAVLMRSIETLEYAVRNFRVALEIYRAR